MSKRPLDAVEQYSVDRWLSENSDGKYQCNDCGARIPENSELCPKCDSIEIEREQQGCDTLSNLGMSEADFL